MIELQNFIDGRSMPADSGGVIDVHEPATGDMYAAAPDSNEADVDAAVDAARRAFPGWAATPAAERSRILLRLADLIERAHERFAEAESRDTGKPVSLARRIDIPRAVANLRFFATAILHGDSAFHDTDGQAINYTLRRTRGVAGCISPWNLPLYLFTWKIAPALASGNTVVGKPSEVTPVTAWMLGGLCDEAGLPPGVLNIVHGRGATGAAIVAHPHVPTVSFTGGTATGAAIATTAGPMFKRLSLELGGKNPNIVFADADMDECIETSVRAAFTNQGQICLCGSRILVERTAYDRFVERFVKRVKSMRVGDPLHADSDLGAIVSMEHLDKIEGCVLLAREEGGEILTGGRRAEAPNDRCRGGWFYKPTVVTGLDTACRTQQEEIFGPVVTIAPFDGEEDAVRGANGTPYGLAALLWTSDLSRAHRVAARIDAGIVWVNCWMLRDLRTPFGGMKQSGLGREGGWDALRFFTEPKNVCVRIGT